MENGSENKKKEAQKEEDFNRAFHFFVLGFETATLISILIKLFK